MKIAMGLVQSASSLMPFNYVNNNYVNLCYDIDKVQKLENALTFKWAIESYYDELGTKPIFLEDNSDLSCDFRFVSRHYNTQDNSTTINVALMGEVFEGAAIIGDGVDIFLDRSLERKFFCKKCKKVHYLQGLAYAKYAEYSGDTVYDPKLLCKQRNKTAKMNKKVMLAASRVAKRSHHFTDVLFRVAVYRKLNNTYGTNFINELSGKHREAGCKKVGFLGDMVKCKEKFTFTLDMENSQIEGYVSEKLFTGLLAGNIPVYFGATDIEKYINPKRIIVCKVSPKKIDAIRRSIILRGVPAEKSLIKFENEFKQEIEKCSDKVNNANISDIASQPIYANIEQMCHTGGLLNWNVGKQLKDIIKK